MIPLLAIIIFMMNFFSSLPLSGGGQEKHGGKEELTQTLVSPAEL